MYGKQVVVYHHKDPISGKIVRVRLCPTCHGTGEIRGFVNIRCDVCGGRGFLNA